MPLASPPHLVVSRFYRYVRNPIYVSFMALVGEVLSVRLAGSPGEHRGGLVYRGGRRALV
jgi:hypothetical protein